MYRLSLRQIGWVGAAPSTESGGNTYVRQLPVGLFVINAINLGKETEAITPFAAAEAVEQPSSHVNGRRWASSVVTAKGAPASDLSAAGALHPDAAMPGNVSDGY